MKDFYGTRAHVFRAINLTPKFEGRNNKEVDHSQRDNISG
jgi:hypothetical protein